ncbi:MAG: hypothetical protein CL607_06285 [Anaerolineaceae bacterium]|nr:hypothetical protein [Anaerolineaceae bacterium]
MVASSSVIAQYPEALCDSHEDAVLASESICHEYMACVQDTPYEERDVFCYFQTYTDLLEQCQTTTERTDCLELSTMYMTRFNAMYGYNPDLHKNVLAFYEAGKYAKAIQMLSEDFYSPEQGFIYATDLVYAILYQAQDQNDKALETYSNVIRHRYDHAIAYYLRGKLYQELGYIEQASRDFYYYSIYAIPALWDLLQPSGPIFSIPQELAAWKLYPVVILYSSPGGETIEDLTLEPATPIQITYLDDGDTALFANMPDEYHPFVSSRPLLIPRNETRSFRLQYDSLVSVDYVIKLGRESYDWIFAGGLGLNYGGKTIAFSQDNMSLYETTVYSESSSGAYYILYPASEPDPREALERPCEGLPMSWLLIGDSLHHTDNYSGHEILDQVDSEVVVVPYPYSSRNSDEPQPQITVIDGPVCGNEHVWWQVSVDDEIVGWISDDYGLLPERVSAVLYDYEIFPTLDDLIEIAND